MVGDVEHVHPNDKAAAFAEDPERFVQAAVEQIDSGTHNSVAARVAETKFFGTGILRRRRCESVDVEPAIPAAYVTREIGANAIDDIGPVAQIVLAVLA